MSETYHIRIKKDCAAAVIEDLEKMKAVDLIKEETDDISEWQKKEVRKRAGEAKRTR